MKAILSIDGGGIRGIIPARFLAALEERAGAPCCKLFDMMAGTSTGGILALGLTRPAGAGPAYSAEQLVALYQREGQHIFSRSAGYEVLSAGGLSGPKYTASGIESVLRSYFGDSKLDEALVPTLVTSYDTQKPGPAFFKSWRNDASCYFMRDVARATSAAPTFFPPLLAAERTFIDGGVFANNPALCAWADAAEVFDRWEDVLVVSLGTGDTEKKSNPTDWGLAKWAPELVTIFMDGNSDCVDYQLRELLTPIHAAGSPRYFRIQCSLAGVTEAMDDASPGTIASLLKLADELVASQSQALDTIAKMLHERDVAQMVAS